MLKSKDGKCCQKISTQTIKVKWNAKLLDSMSQLTESIAKTKTDNLTTKL